MSSVFSHVKRLIPKRIRAALGSLHYSIDCKYTEFYVKHCRISPHKIVFCSYFGGGYGDNPKYIADELLRRDLGWDLVWEVQNPEEPLPEGIRAVRYGSNKAKREIASAKYYVDNARNSLRPQKKDGQIHLQTWHGFGFKAVEKDVEDRLSEYYVSRAMRDGQDSDGIISACSIQTEEFRRAFWLNEKTTILETGLPRNDKLFDPATVSQVSKKVRISLKIPDERKIILYMPTFRNSGGIEAYQLDFKKIVDTFQKRFSVPFSMVIRLHPNVRQLAETICCDECITNATTYPDAQELYMAADYLITDYSSTAFDFCLMGKPVFLCALDYLGYEKERGLTNLYNECPFPKNFSNDELISCIQEFSLDTYNKELALFLEKWRPFGKGDASSKIVDWLLSR